MRLMHSMKSRFKTLLQNDVKLEKDQTIVFLLLGIATAFVLNFGTPLYPFSALFVVGIVLVLCFALVLLLKGHFMNLRTLFLGASITSLIFAFRTFFFSLVMEEMIQITFDNLWGLFRSVLLTSLFSLLERLTRFIEDKIETRKT